jgi:hypothetical protein
MQPAEQQRLTRLAGTRFPALLLLLALPCTLYITMLLPPPRPRAAAGRMRHAANVVARWRREQWSRELPQKVQSTFQARSVYRSEKGYTRFDMVGPVAKGLCPSLESFGSGDEEKMACALTQMEAPCTLISIGSNNEWGFEEAAANRTPCAIETFDCTLEEGAAPPASLRHRVRLHPVCLGAETRTDPKTGQRFADWPTLVRMAGLARAPRYVKMDIEGFGESFAPSGSSQHAARSHLVPRRVRCSVLHGGCIRCRN